LGLIRDSVRICIHECTNLAAWLIPLLNEFDIAEYDPYHCHLMLTANKESFFGLVEVGLKTMHLYSDAQSVNATRVYEMNNALIVEFVPQSYETLDIKLELAAVMGFLHGLLKEEYDYESRFSNFCGKAITTENEELMYVVCSPRVAGYIGEGRSIEWLRNSHFQINTPEQRLTMAKTRVSRIENGLRELIDVVLTELHGETWFTSNPNGIVPKATENTFKNASKNVQNKSTLTSRQSLNYVYLDDLRNLLISNWENFSNYYDSRSDFNNKMKELNLLRRDEGHNREISQTAFNALEALQQYFMEGICQKLPYAAEGYLVENWRNSLSSIGKSLLEVQRPEDWTNPIQLVNYLTDLKDTILSSKQSMGMVTVPPGKRNVHSEFVSILSEIHKILAELLSCIESGDVNQAKVLNEKYSQAWTSLKEWLAKYLMLDQ